MKKETPLEWLIDKLTDEPHKFLFLSDKHDDMNVLIKIIIQAKAKEKQYLIDELEDVLYEDNKIDFDDPNYRKDVIEYGLTKVNNLKKELYAKS
jgi:hypothetical protein